MHMSSVFVPICCHIYSHIFQSWVHELQVFSSISGVSLFMQSETYCACCWLLDSFEVIYCKYNMLPLCQLNGSVVCVGPWTVHLLVERYSTSCVAASGTRWKTCAYRLIPEISLMFYKLATSWTWCCLFTLVIVGKFNSWRLCLHIMCQNMEPMWWTGRVVVFHNNTTAP